MLFVETRPCTRRVLDLLPDDHYRELQDFLTRRPDAGVVIPGSGGLRKIRWRSTSTGKRGGVRVIYYWQQSTETIVMLFVFAKNERSDLTKAQLGALREIVSREYR